MKSFERQLFAQIRQKVALGVTKQLMDLNDKQSKSGD